MSPLKWEENSLLAWKLELPQLARICKRAPFQERVFPQSWRVPAWHKISLGSLTGHSTDFTKRVSYENTLCNQLAGQKPVTVAVLLIHVHGWGRARNTGRILAVTWSDSVYPPPSLFLELPGRVVTIKWEGKLMLQPGGRVIRLMKSSLRIHGSRMNHPTDATRWKGHLHLHFFRTLSNDWT